MILYGRKEIIYERISSTIKDHYMPSRKMNTPFMDVDSYIKSFPKESQKRLQELRQLIKASTPEASEGISYNMPAYKLNGKPLLYFAGYAGHIGLYATPSAHEAFERALAGYKKGKGSVQFPHNEPLPLDLIARMISFRKDTIIRQQKK